MLCRRNCLRGPYLGAARGPFRLQFVAQRIRKQPGSVVAPRWAMMKREVCNRIPSVFLSHTGRGRRCWGWGGVGGVRGYDCQQRTALLSVGWANRDACLHTHPLVRCPLLARLGLLDVLLGQSQGGWNAVSCCRLRWETNTRTWKCSWSVVRSLLIDQGVMKFKC